MGKRFRVLAIKPEDITPVSKRIYLVGRGYADITLHADGEIKIIASNPYVSDGMVKRDIKYKDIITELSEKIWHEYEKLDAVYKEMHLALKKTIYSKGSYEKKVNQVERKRYTRRIFALPQPSSSEVSEDLKKEAAAIYHHEEGVQRSRLVSDFVSKNLSKYLVARQEKWNEAKALFEEIETAIEQKENAANEREYQRQRQEILDFVNGVPAVFEPAFDKMVSELQIPFTFDLDYTYSQDEGCVNVNVTLLNGVEIPLEKAVLLSSGRISIKNKLVREIDQDTTETILSFIYLLTGKIFSVSPNVSIVDFTLWKSGMTDGLCWVEFTRNEFARNISPALETITDIQNYNRVMDLKVRNGATVINSIAKQKFEKLVKQASNNV